MIRLLKLALTLLVLWITPVYAVQPDEVLDDPMLEGRARELSKELRCLVCRNENIDESNADLARDLRLVLRERLVAGDSDQEALDFIVDRYGEYALLKPTAKGSNWLLWAAGPLMLLMALVMSFFYLRKRSVEPTTQSVEGLSAEEQARLQEILDR